VIARAIDSAYTVTTAQNPTSEYGLFHCNAHI
jgi:hypothetical protein